MKNMLACLCLMAPAFLSAQTDLTIREAIVKSQTPPKDYIFGITRSLLVKTKSGDITITCEGNNIGKWKVEGLHLSGTITSVNEALNEWIYVCGKDTVKIVSDCPTGRDWSRFIGWTVTEGNDSASIRGTEPDCMSSYYWVIKPDSVSCDYEMLVTKANLYATYSADGKEVCVPTSWKVSRGRKIPAQYSDRIRLASAFIAFVSLSLRETTRMVEK